MKDIKQIRTKAIILNFIIFSFNLFAQEISTIGEIYDFEVGDEFHIDYETWWQGSDGGEYHYYNDKILDKYYSENNDTVFYVIEQKHKWAYSPYHEWSYNQDTILEFYTNLSELIRDGDIDTVYSDPEFYNGRLINSKEFEFSGDEEEIFKYVDGLGLAYYYYYYYNLSGIEGGEIIRLRYFKKGNEEWGTPYPLLPIDEILTVAEVYDYEIGDIFHIESSDSVYGAEYNTLYNKEIISKVFNGNYSVTYEIAVKEMLTTSENPEPVYDDYIDIEYYNYIDNPINGSEVDSIYINPSFYNGRVVNTWNYGNSNTEMIKFKFVEGCGEASYYKSYWLENDYFEKNDELIYFKKGDEEWGTPQYILSKSFTDPLAQWNVAKTYPNANPQNPNFVETTTKTYGFDGDTIIGNQTWLKFYSSPDSAFSNELFYEGCLLDDNGIVKFRDNENTIDTIYNFSLSAGDSVLYNFDYGSSYMKIESIDSVEINEQYFKRFIFEENIDYPPFFLSEVWIEGIGSIHGPLFPKYPKLFSDEIPDSLNLTCYKIDNSIMWNNPFYDVCYVNIILSIKELSKNRIYIFPNPARDLIQFTNPYNQTFSYKISSINGQLVKSESRNENNQIDISELNPGIYILKIYQTDKYFYKKLIKE